MGYAQAYAIVARRYGRRARLRTNRASGRVAVGHKHGSRCIWLGEGETWEDALYFAGLV